MNEKKERDSTAFGAAPLADDAKQYIIATLKKEGFSEEQLNEMTLERVWELFIDSSAADMSSQFSELYRGLTHALEANPKFASLLSPLLKKMKHELEKEIEFLEKKAREKEEGEGTSHE